MNVRNMYPSAKFDGLDLRDFMADDTMAITIERIDFKTEPSKYFGEPKVDWYIFARELKKPIKIPPRSGFEIAEILGEQDNDNWIGRTIGIKAVYADVYGKGMWLVNFWGVGNLQPILPAKTDLTGYGSWSDSQKTQLDRLLAADRSSPPPRRLAGGGKDAAAAPMGARVAAGIIVALRERGTDWSGLEADCRRGECLELIDGMMPAACPIALAQRARVYCGLNPVTNPVDDATREAEIEKLIRGWEPPTSAEAEKPEIAADAGEVIDKKTGEVIAEPAGDPVADDGIPF